MQFLNELKQLKIEEELSIDNTDSLNEYKNPVEKVKYTIGFLHELSRSKVEQAECNKVYNNFKDDDKFRNIRYPGGTGGSGPGGGSWWWLESGKEAKICDGTIV